MQTCKFCDRTANVKIVVRDEWGRPRELLVCDHHIERAEASENQSQHEYMEKFQ